jgi:hypothetical protein
MPAMHLATTSLCSSAHPQQAHLKACTCAATTDFGGLPGVIASLSRSCCMACSQP